MTLQEAKDFVLAEQAKLEAAHEAAKAANDIPADKLAWMTYLKNTKTAKQVIVIETLKLVNRRA